jgi:hypothetical protein
LPHAACFVVPNIPSIDQYRSARRTAKANWANLKKREQLAIFLPNDASPQKKSAIARTRNWRKQPVH